MVYLFRSILKQHTEKSFLRLSKINAVHKVCIYGILFVQVNFEATHWKIISKAPEINAVHKVCIYGIFVQVNFEATHWKILSKALKNKCCAQGVYIWYICSGQF